MEPSNEQNPQQISSPPEITPPNITGKPNIFLVVKSNPMLGILFLAIVLMFVGVIILGARSNQHKNITSQPLIKTSTPIPVKPTSANTANLDVAPKMLGNCPIQNTKDYTVTNCVNIQLANSSSPSRSVYIVINPIDDSNKAKVQTIASQAGTLCGTITGCNLDIFDNTQAANEEYKQDLLSQASVKQYINDPKNNDAVSLTVEHLIAQFSPPNSFTYEFIATPTLSPTPTPIPTDENGFPMDAEAVTVAQIAKVPSAYNGRKVTFTCNVSGFAKNDSGDAAALNCSDPNDVGSIIQVGGSLFDFTKINQGDTVRIYGLGAGAATGKNAFGGDVTEGIVDGLYLNDLTSIYKN
jgi:hypothetical protein